MFFFSGKARLIFDIVGRSNVKASISADPDPVVHTKADYNPSKVLVEEKNKLPNKEKIKLANKGMNNRCPNACRGPRKQMRRIEIVPHPSNRRRYIVCWKNGRFQCGTCGKEKVFRITKRDGRCVPGREQEEVSTGVIYSVAETFNSQSLDRGLYEIN